MRPTRCADLDGFLAQMQEIKSRRYVELTARREITPRPGVVRLLQKARAAHGAELVVNQLGEPATPLTVLDDPLHAAARRDDRYPPP